MAKAVTTLVFNILLHAEWQSKTKKYINRVENLHNDTARTELRGS